MRALFINRGGIQPTTPQALPQLKPAVLFPPTAAHQGVELSGAGSHQRGGQVAVLENPPQRGHFRSERFVVPDEIIIHLFGILEPIRVGVAHVPVVGGTHVNREMPTEHHADLAFLTGFQSDAVGQHGVAPIGGRAVRTGILLHGGSKQPHQIAAFFLRGPGNPYPPPRPVRPPRPAKESSSPAQ